MNVSSALYISPKRSEMARV